MKRMKWGQCPKKRCRNETTQTINIGTLDAWEHTARAGAAAEWRDTMTLAEGWEQAGADTLRVREEWPMKSTAAFKERQLQRGKASTPKQDCQAFSHPQTCSYPTYYDLIHRVPQTVKLQPSYKEAEKWGLTTATPMKPPPGFGSCYTAAPAHCLPSARDTCVPLFVCFILSQPKTDVCLSNLVL